MKNVLKFLSLILLICLFFLSAGQVQAQNDPESEAVEESSAASVNDDGIPPRGQMGFIEVITKPPKAIAYLDGDELGITPIEKREFRSGRFDFTIILDGEELVKERINIWPDKTTLIKRELTLPYGSIILSTKPGYTRVFIDGEQVGKTTGGPLTINNISAGTHILKVTARKRGSREVEVTVEGEDTVKVDISLGR